MNPTRHPHTWICCHPGFSVPADVTASEAQNLHRQHHRQHMTTAPFVRDADTATRIADLEAWATTLGYQPLHATHATQAATAIRNHRKENKQ